MPQVQFKDAVKHNGMSYRQNERVTLPEPTAARLVALGVAELPGGRRGSPGFEAAVDAFRSAQAKKVRPTVPKATREKVAAEKRDFFRRAGWLETATQF